MPRYIFGLFCIVFASFAELHENVADSLEAHSHGYHMYEKWDTNMDAILVKKTGFSKKEIQGSVDHVYSFAPFDPKASRHLFLYETQLPVLFRLFYSAHLFNVPPPIFA